MYAKHFGKKYIRLHIYSTAKTHWRLNHGTLAPLCLRYPRHRSLAPDPFFIFLFFLFLLFFFFFFFFLRGHNTCIACRIFVYFNPLARKKGKRLLKIVLSDPKIILLSILWNEGTFERKGSNIWIYNVKLADSVLSSQFMYSSCLCWGFTAQSTQWGHVERSQFT